MMNQMSPPPPYQQMLKPANHQNVSNNEQDKVGCPNSAYLIIIKDQNKWPNIISMSIHVYKSTRTCYNKSFKVTSLEA